MSSYYNLLINNNPDLSKTKCFRLGSAPGPANHEVWPISEENKLYYMYDVINGVRIIEISEESQCSVIWKPEDPLVHGKKISLGDYVRIRDGFYLEWKILPKPDAGQETFMYHGWYNFHVLYNLDNANMKKEIDAIKKLSKLFNRKLYIDDKSIDKPEAYLYAHATGELNKEGMMTYDLKYAGFTSECWVSKVAKEMVHRMLRVARPKSEFDEMDQLIIY